MSRFQKLSHVVWHCQYHIVWVPKYRYRVLRGPVAEEVYKCIQVFSGKERPYWGNHFWAEGYCVDTVGLDAEMIRKYVVFQEKKERTETK